MTTITEQLGRVLAGRYRLDAGLGTGSSAHVYAAFDTRLRRVVAVKLLHPGLAGDEGFLRRLRAEAQAVAALNHPNVLKVFDWGEEDDGPFLVLEYLGGGSLQDLLDAGGRLDPAQVATVGAQAARGLAYAHRRGFVHRDVKPGNLLFDEDGGLRVADFGLARALAEAAWTEPAGAVLGTARYASPEQAEGRPLDDRSDVYSLALVLYEAVVGRVPFSADTTLATLMARVRASLPAAPELGPLAPILAQAAIAEPVARLDAPELADNLELLARQLPAPRPLPLAGRPVRGGARGAIHPDAAPAATSGAGAPAAGAIADAAATLDAARPRLYDREADGPAPATHGATRPLLYDREAGGALDGAPAAPEGSGPDRGAAPERRGDGRGPRRRALRVALVSLVVVAVLVAGGAAAVRFVVYGHAVPSLRAMPLGRARAAVARSGLRLLERGAEFSSTVAAGAVISQSLAPGTSQRSGTVVSVVVSKGHEPVPVPTLTGRARSVAVGLARSGHLVPVVATAYSETVPAGDVVTSSPSSGTAAFGGTVHIVVSSGPAPRTIPSGLAGATWPAAAARLGSLRLTAVERLAYSDSVASGDVISTSPASGTSGVAVGSPVDVVVSRGPRTVAVPTVRGLSIPTAIAQLTRAGLSVTEQVGPPFATYATTTDPAPGTEVRPGSSVTLYVA